ncbi:MAG: hypothetical protein IJU12_08875, partial [Clostridia bacterium]|nr:hypothetical protein [Clostridia bacterium]
VAAETLPEAAVSVSCDLTKLHELTLRGPIAEVLRRMEQNAKTEKGEYCIVFDLRQVPKIVEKPQADISLEAQLVEAMLKSDCSLRDASKALIEAGNKKNAVYAASLRLKELFEEE